MPIADPSILHKVAAAIYALAVPGHIMMGFQTIYPALEKIPKAKYEDRVGVVGSVNCWDYVASALGAMALLHWQWARTGGPQTLEETTILGLMSGHLAWNAFRYIRVGEKFVGTLLLASVASGVGAVTVQKL